jgi:hypothetical protein
MNPTIKPISTEPLPETQIFRGDQIALAPQPAIAAPSGGGTQDTESRAAIVSILDTLEKLGFIKP